MAWPTEKKVTSVFVLLLVVLLAVQTISHWSLKRRSETEQLIARSQEVLEQIAAMRLALHEAVDAHCHLLLTGSNASRTAYQEARARIESHVAELRRLVRDGAQRGGRLDQLAERLRDELTAFHAALDDAATPDPQDQQVGRASEVAAALARERGAADRLRTAVVAVDAEQRQVLAGYTVVAQGYSRRNFSVAVIEIVLSSALLLCAYVLVLRYVTYRNRAQARIERLNQEMSHRADELQTLLDIVPVGVAVAGDPHCRSIRGNKAMTRLLGAREGANLSLSAASCDRPSYRCLNNGRDVRPDEMPMQIAAATGVAVSGWEFELVSGDGGPSAARLCGSAVPLFDAGGKPRGAVGAFWDVAHFKDAQRRLKQERDSAMAASVAKDRLLSEVSHDLRTPLAATLIWGKLIKDGMLEGPDREKAADAIIASAEAQVRLIEDLLDATRISHGKLQLSKTVLDLGAVVRSACQLVAPLAEDRAISFSTRLPLSPRLVSGDEPRLTRVFWNLLSNALKFTPSGGEVTVSLTASATDVCVRVSDTGEGISAELLPHVFDPFRQGSAADGKGGVGLGLSIVWHVVRLHGGNVEVRSCGKGQGSTVAVTLPILSTPNVLSRKGAARLDEDGVAAEMEPCPGPQHCSWSTTCRSDSRQRSGTASPPSRNSTS